MSIWHQLNVEHATSAISREDLGDNVYRKRIVSRSVIVSYPYNISLKKNDTSAIDYNRVHVVDIYQQKVVAPSIQLFKLETNLLILLIQLRNKAATIRHVRAQYRIRLPIKETLEACTLSILVTVLAFKMCGA